MLAPGMLALVACLSGCEASFDGAPGIGVDEAGAPVGYAVTCDGSLTDVVLTEAGAGSSAPAGWSWQAIRPLAAGTVTSVQLTRPDPGPGWGVRDPAPPQLQPGVAYDLGSGTDGHWANDLRFTLADLAAMRPGQVRYQVYPSGSGDEDVFTVGSLQDFVRATCDRS